MFRWFLVAFSCLTIAAEAIDEGVTSRILLNCGPVPLEDIYRIQVIARGALPYLVLNERDGEIETALPSTSSCVSLPQRIELPSWQGMKRALELRAGRWVIETCGPVTCESQPANCR